MYYNYGYDSYYAIGYLCIFVGFIITLIAQGFVSNSYSKYKRVISNKNIKGYEVARRILDSNGLKDVKIVEVSGHLSDHYDPKNKVVRLSSDIYNGTSIASIAVSAHECGHAIQDKEGYLPLRIRSFIVPIVNISDKLGYFVIFIGFLFGMIDLALLGLLIVSFILVFQLVTLPVEFNASNRAKRQIKELGIAGCDEVLGVSKMLTAAAMTYVASVINTLLQLLRLFLIILSRRNDD